MGRCASSAAFVRVQKREREEKKEGWEGIKLRWRIYERPKQAANLSPSSLSIPFFFFFHFVSYSDLSTSSRYTWPCFVAVPHRAAYVKTQFHLWSLYTTLLLLCQLSLPPTMFFLF